MSTDLESKFRCRRQPQRDQPSPHTAAKLERALGRPRSIVGGGCRQAKQSQGAVAQKTGDHPATGDRFLVDQRMKYLQQIARLIRSKLLAQGCKTGQVNEENRRILSDRFDKKIRIESQPLLYRGCLK